MLLISVMSTLSLAFAQVLPGQTLNIYTWTDKSGYLPGEKGTLRMIIRNDRTDVDLILQNITLLFPWFAYTGGTYDGNYTVKPASQILNKNGGNVYSTSVDFTVPSDGRIIAPIGSQIQNIDIRIFVDKAPLVYDTTARIYVKSTSMYSFSRIP